MVLVGAWQLYSSSRGWFWRKTPCTITSSQVSPDGTSYQFEASYTYVVGDQSYNGHFRSGTSPDYNQAGRLLLRYPAGLKTLSYVSGSNAQESSLQRPGVIGMVFFLVFTGFATIFLFTGVSAICMRLVLAQDDPSPSPDKPPGFWARWSFEGPFFALVAVSYLVPAIVFSLFTVAGVADLSLNFVKPMCRLAASKNWTETPCDVISSRVQTFRKQPRYRADILYSYRVNGQEYKSSQYAIYSRGSRDSATELAVVGRFPSGTSAVCYVNPNDPLDAVLSRTVSPDAWTIGLFVGLLLSAIGLSGFAWGISRFWHRAKHSNNSDFLRTPNDVQVDGRNS